MAAISSPLLMIETPRAGVFGHRFLVSDLNSLGDTSPDVFFSRAAISPIGPDYLSASRQVKQELPGGSIRSGPETILVARIRCDRIAKEEVAEIVQWLEARLETVEEIIAGLPDNRRAGAATVLTSPALTAWQNELSEMVPAAAVRTQSLPLKTVAAGFILGAAAAALLLQLCSRTP